MTARRLLLALLAFAGCASEQPAPPGGNILVIVADDLGPEQIGAYGDPQALVPTPNIDALAERGVRFTNAYATPSCSPSRAALLTGRQPRRYGLGIRVDAARESFELPDAEIALPELLQRSPLGYRSAAVGKWHLAGLTSPSGARHPLALGFEHYAGSFANLRVASKPSEERLDYFHWQKNTDGKFAFTDTYATTDTANDAIAQIASLSDPWFLWVAFNAVHIPIHRPPRELLADSARPGTERAARFGAMITALDRELGRLLDSLTPEVRARTTVMFVSDNGTAERATQRLPAAGEDSRYGRGKNTLYQGGIRVPLIVAGPHVARPGTTSDALVHISDVFATVAKIAGVEPEGPIDGIDLLPQLANPDTPSERRLLYIDFFGPNGPGPYALDQRMVTDGRYKLIEYAERDQQEFFEPVDTLDDGPDLLSGELSDDQQRAYEHLQTELRARIAEYDAERRRRYGPPRSSRSAAAAFAQR